MGKVRAHDDPHGQVLSLQKNGLSGDGALDFPQILREDLEAQAGRQEKKTGSQFCSLANVGSGNDGMGLVQEGKTG